MNYSESMEPVVLILIVYLIVQTIFNLQKAPRKDVAFLSFVPLMLFVFLIFTPTPDSRRLAYVSNLVDDGKQGEALELLKEQADGDPILVPKDFRP